MIKQVISKVGKLYHLDLFGNVVGDAKPVQAFFFLGDPPRFVLKAGSIDRSIYLDPADANRLRQPFYFPEISYMGNKKIEISFVNEGYRVLFKYDSFLLSQTPEGVRPYIQ